ncbi:MAG TPA: secondary thiamine-phosphate synthase enzyme YjbQ [Bryobacteraceae bacterium]|nr:secondary thiamine-phosphate synthase enzyme YjbQ [Bryobacteraceae bacterium]
MKQFVCELKIPTRGTGLYEITDRIGAWVSGQKLTTGLLTAFVKHTSASVVIQENADPDVIRDLDDFMSRIAPEDDPNYRHTIEGSDDMPAHIRAALTATQVSIPLIAGRLALGTWQGVYLFEHRRAPHSRTVALHLLGE